MYPPLVPRAEIAGCYVEGVSMVDKVSGKSAVVIYP
jgi:hypothetical protein